MLSNQTIQADNILTFLMNFLNNFYLRKPLVSYYSKHPFHIKPLNSNKYFKPTYKFQNKQKKAGSHTFITYIKSI